MKTYKNLMIAVVLIIGVLPGIYAADDAGTKLEIEKYSGNVLCLDASGPDRSVRLFMSIEEFSSDEEIAELEKILKEQGQNQLLDTMWDMKGKGYIKIDNSLGYQVVVFQKIVTPEGMTIRAIMDRPIQMFEYRHALRSRDYPLGFIELKIGADGKGEGSLMAAAKAYFKDDELKMERSIFRI